MHTWQPANPLLLHPAGTARPQTEVRTIRLWVVAVVVLLALAAAAPSVLAHWALAERAHEPAATACDGGVRGVYRSRAEALAALAEDTDAGAPAPSPVAACR
jgi:hypothetical protein